MNVRKVYVWAVLVFTLTAVCATANPLWFLASLLVLF